MASNRTWKLTSEDDDDDGYWESKTSFKNMFDDEDDDDGTEIVTWDGEPISSSALSAQSARYRKPEKPKNDPRKSESPNLFADRSEEQARAKRESDDRATSLAEAILTSDRPAASSQSKKPSTVGSATESARLQAEVNFLRRQKQEAESSRWTSLPVDDTIKRILSGELYHLETYKSLEEKLSLLDAAIRSRDGNAVTAVVVFFHNSVKNNIFLTQMKRRPEALDHYLQYLRQTSRIPELIEALGMFGLNEEAAILKFSQSTKVKNPDQKIKSLKSCLRAHYQSDPSLSDDAAIIEQQIRLLEVQQPINQSDSEVAAKAKETVRQLKLQQQQQEQPSSSAELKLSPEIEIFARFPRPSTLFDLPLLTSLSYCYMYHFGKPPSFFGSPDYFRKTFGTADKQTKFALTEKQFAWVALKAHARLARWDEINKLLITKSWFGKTKKIDVDFKRVATILSKQGADQRIINSYLLEVEDVDERLATALKIQCHLGVVDAFASAKDRLGLENYARKLQGEEGLHAALLLKNPSIKWKN